MRSRSFLGQAAPAAKGPARALAERMAGSASGFSYSPKVSNPASTLYPGRMIFRPEEVSLYVISFRIATEGNATLYEVEGPNQGTWRIVPIADLSSTYVVSEPESKVIRNMAPTIDPPLSDGRDVDILYPISLYEGAMFQLGSIPPEEVFYQAQDPSVKDDVTSEVITAVSLIMEAVDSSAMAYDSLFIGQNALLLLNHIGTTLMTSALTIMSGLLRAQGDPGAYAAAARKASELGANFPLFGLYLERAYYWSLLDAFNGAGILRDNSRVYMSDLRSALAAASASPQTFLEKSGASVEELKAAVQLGSNYISAFSGIDAQFDQFLDTELKGEFQTREDIKFGSIAIPNLLQENKKAIEALNNGGLSRLPSSALGAGPTTPKPKVSVDQMANYNVVKDAVGQNQKVLTERYNQVVSESTNKAIVPMAEKDALFDYAQNVRTLLLKGNGPGNIFKTLTLRMRTIASAAERAEVDIISAETTPAILKDLSEKEDAAEGAAKRIELSVYKESNPLDYLKTAQDKEQYDQYTKLKAEAFNYRQARQFLNVEAGRLEPNVLKRLDTYSRQMDGLRAAANNWLELEKGITKEAPPYPETFNVLSSTWKKQLAVLMMPKEFGIYNVRLENLTGSEFLVTQIADMTSAVNLNNFALRAFLENFSDARASDISKEDFYKRVANTADGIASRVIASKADVPGLFTDPKQVAARVAELDMLASRYTRISAIATGTPERAAVINSIPMIESPPTAPITIAPTQADVAKVTDIFNQSVAELDEVVLEEKDNPVQSPATAVVAASSTAIKVAVSEIQKAASGPTFDEAAFNAAVAKASNALRQGDPAAQAVSLARVAANAGGRIRRVTFFKRSILAISNGVNKVYKFVSEIPTWRKISMAVGFGGVIIGLIASLISKEKILMDPKGNDIVPPTEEGWSTYRNLALTGVGLVAGYYLIRKGIPFLMEKFKGWKMSATPSPSVVGLSGLPRRRKRKTTPKRTHKRRKTYPGPGKNFMEMQ